MIYYTNKTLQVKVKNKGTKRGKTFSGNICLLRQLKGPLRVVGYELGPNLMRQKEANDHKIETAATRRCGLEGHGLESRRR